MINLTPIFEAIVTLSFAVITAFVVPWLNKRLSTEKLETIQYWVTIGVEAAEQMFSGSGRGAEKLKYVEEFMQSKGFEVDTETLRAMIESAVLGLAEKV